MKGVPASLTGNPASASVSVMVRVSSSTALTPSSSAAFFPSLTACAFWIPNSWAARADPVSGITARCIPNTKSAAVTFTGCSQTVGVSPFFALGRVLQ